MTNEDNILHRRSNARYRLTDCSAIVGGGSNVRVVARDPDKASELLGNRADIRPGDVTDARSIREAITEDYKAIFFTVAATGGIDDRGLFGSKAMIRAATYQGLLNVVDAARSSGFKGRIILSSAMGADRSSLIISILNTIKSGLQRNLIERERYLRASGLDYTIVRAPILTNAPAGEANVRITRAINKLTGGPKISRGDLARVMKSWPSVQANKCIGNRNMAESANMSLFIPDRQISGHRTTLLGLTFRRWRTPLMHWSRWA